jgi:MoaA/NifB/PqqE/SkfB family radical SAM enzyme
VRLRSRNSDLLLPEFMESQVREALAYFLGRAPLRVHRVTAFVTHRCNLFCDYCTGPHLTTLEGDAERKKAMLRHDVSVETYERHLDGLLERSEGIDHVHFTGGEATLARHLPELVDATRARGLLSSITSNGLAGPARYAELVRRGLSEVRISLDSADPDEFDRVVGKPGAFPRVVESLREVARLRDEEGRDVFLVLNACVGDANLGKVEETTRFLLSLGPNDFKYLLIVQDKAAVMARRDDALVARLHALLEPFPRRRFFLLRRKIDNLFRPEAQAVMKHCFIPMTERTIDGQHYYPCSIYTRWYGAPLGSIDEPFEVQQAKSERFTREHDCRQDPICQRYCVNCCKVYNVVMNWALLAERATLDAGERALETGPTDAEVDDALARLRALEAGLDPDAVARPFLIIKPHGAAARAELLRLIEAEGLAPEVTPLPAWHELSCLLYCREATPAAMRKALETSRFLAGVEGSEAWLVRFTAPPAEDALLKLKYRLRTVVPTLRWKVRTPTKVRTIHQTVVHLPDTPELPREAHLVERALAAV